MEFKNKQYDGPFEVSEIEIYISGDKLRGILYFPPDEFKKPYPLIIYFHEFPQLLSFQEIVKEYKYLLDMGYALLIFNFRGYRLSEGKISINSQFSDGLKVFEFASKMADKEIFEKKDINVLANDFGAYIALLVSHKTDLINRLLLLSPIIDLEKKVYNDEFKIVLEYVKRFLPTNIRGISKIEEFINFTKEELSNKQLNLWQITQDLKYKDLKIIIGSDDKITSAKEVKKLIKSQDKEIELSIIENMDHEPYEENEINKIREEIKLFFD